MKTLMRSHFAASVLGGLVVAGAFLLFGVAGHRTTEFIQSPIDQDADAASDASPLTPHNIYVRDAPGVVFVRAQIIEQEPDPFDLFPPQQQSSSSTGSGFLIDSSGDILTNYHVIEGANRQNGVSVQFEDNVSRRAAVVGVDPNNDLALLRVDMHGVPPVEPLQLGDSENVQVGDTTLAIGNPFGLDRTLTSGIVSALQRQITAPNGFAIDNVIQTDAPINPGNSGGPLLDAEGRVIGINSQIETAAGGDNGSVGIGFAIPIDTAKAFLPRLEHGVKVAVAYLGISGASSSRSQPGVVVQAAYSHGPAAVAGLRRGDSIEEINGQRVATIEQVQGLVAASSPGAKMEVEYRRGKLKRTIAVKLGQRPERAP
jgi:S1-C subfamily serine protease